MKIEIPLHQQDTGRKVREVILDRYPLSARTLRWLRYHARLLVDDKLLKPSDYLPKGAEQLVIEMEEPESDKLSQENESSKHYETDIPLLEIEYEDPYLLVVWKPAGIPVHASSADDSGWNVDLLVRQYLQTKQSFPVGRLDQEVSGFLVFGKNHLIASLLETLKETGQLHKTYQALCHGHWKECSGTIDVPIAKAEGFNRWQTNPKGKPALSHYNVLENGPQTSLVEVEIETGRTHQIRLHMCFMGHPIVGDQYYGIEDGVKSCQLCACRLAFPHPIDNKPLQFSRPAPFLLCIPPET